MVAVVDVGGGLREGVGCAFAARSVGVSVALEHRVCCINDYKSSGSASLYNGRPFIYDTLAKTAHLPQSHAAVSLRVSASIGLSGIN